MANELERADVNFTLKGDDLVEITFSQGETTVAIQTDRDGIDDLIGGLRRARDKLDENEI